MSEPVKWSALSITELLSLIRETGDDNAIAEIERRGKLIDPDIFDLLGRIYLNGYGQTAQDCNKAIKYYSEGIACGAKILCPLGLANAYYFGLCVKQNYEKAFELTRRVAANEKDWIAASRLALMYESGHGCSKDLKEAANWMYISWKHGSLIALAHYGRILVKDGRIFVGNLIRIGSWSLLPIIFARGMSDRRCRIW